MKHTCLKETQRAMKMFILDKSALGGLVQNLSLWVRGIFGSMTFSSPFICYFGLYSISSKMVALVQPNWARLAAPTPAPASRDSHVDFTNLLTSGAYQRIKSASPSKSLYVSVLLPLHPSSTPCNFIHNL